jgi:hypothetical protein
LGTKQHLLADANGVPMTIRMTGANRHDLKEILALMVQMPAIEGKPGHPRLKPKVVKADRAYHEKWANAFLEWLDITLQNRERLTEGGWERPDGWSNEQSPA